MIEALDRFPGGDLVQKGLSDLESRTISQESLLVLVGSPRLRSLGFLIKELPMVVKPYEHRLFELIEELSPSEAHAKYNSLIQRLVSFENTYAAETPQQVGS